MGVSASQADPLGMMPVVRTAEDEQVPDDFNEEDDEEMGDEETEEEWRLRREGSAGQTKLDIVKRMLAVAFFTGLGIIVIVVAATATPLITSTPEDELQKNATHSPTAMLGMPMHGN